MRRFAKLLAAVPLVMATSIWLWISTVRAHEFIIKPASLRVNAGDKVPFSVLSTHVFMSGEELLSAKTVKASLLEGNKSVDLPLKENNILQTLDGTVAVHTKGTAVIAGHLLEPVETLTAQDTAKAQRARFEKFSKTLIVVEASDRNYEKFWVIGWKSSPPPIPRRRESETNWFSGFFLTANHCRLMFLPPMMASADTTTLTPTRLNQETASLGSRLPIPAHGWFVLREEWRWQRRTMIFTCSKPSWFFPCNSAGLKFGFGPERVRS
jgi:hypothetical protein